MKITIDKRITFVYIYTMKQTITYTKGLQMGNVEKLERNTKEMQEAISTFEKDAKAEGMNIDRETNSPKGYWYCNQQTNMAFYWFLNGTSYGKLVERLNG